MILAWRDRMARIALLASGCFALGGCIDTPVSLGHHEVTAPIGDGDGDTMDAAMGASGGIGGVSGSSGMGGSGGTGGGGAGGGLPVPASPCDSGTLYATLECQIDDPFTGQPGQPPAEMMRTRTTLALTRTSLGLADVTGVLEFEAWNLSFDGRVEGVLDCMQGELHAAIVDGVATMQNSGDTFRFVGALDSMMIDPFDGTISGPWWHGPDMPGRAICVGPWLATRN